MSRPFELRVGEEEGARLDVFLSGAIEGLTRSGAQRLIETGRVFVNGKAAPKRQLLLPGDRVSGEVPDPEPIAAAPQDIPLAILYEDDDLLVVDKPKGMVVHPAPGHPEGTLVNALLAHCGGSLSGIAAPSTPRSAATPSGARRWRWAAPPQSPLSPTSPCSPGTGDLPICACA